MAASMIIDQAGLPAGTAGKARTDGLATGALVTLTSAGGGTTHRFQLLWAPTAAWATAPASLTQTTPTTWTFTPPAGVYGTYRIELIVDEGLSTEDRQIRIFGVRTPVKGLRLPALNEIASSLATLLDNGADQIAASEANENIVGGPFAAGNYGGWYPELELAFDEIEAGGGGGSGKQTAKIIVGNSVAGDTLAVCDYLDIGDGAQLSAALAAAGADADVYIRPGTYDLGAGATVAPLAIPASVHVRGAGWFQTRITCKSSGNMGAFSLANFSSLRDLSITVPVTTAPGAGATAVVQVNGTICDVEKVAVQWTPGYGAPEVANLVLRASFGSTGSANVAFERCLAGQMPSLRDLGVADDLCGFNADAGAASIPQSYSRCYAQGGDIGFRTAIPANLYDCSTIEHYASHVSVLAGVVDQGCVVDKHTAIAASLDPTGGFIRVTSKQTRVNDCTVRWTGGMASTAPGISLVGADECVLKGNVVVFCGTGINLDATSDNNIVLMNQLPTCVTAVNDLGAGNDIAHNI